MSKRLLAVCLSTFAGVLLLALAFSAPTVYSTAPQVAPDDAGGGEVVLGEMDDMPAAERQAIEAQIAANQAQLYAEGKLQQPTQPTQVSFAWPLKPLFADFGYHAIANYVDHDPTFPNHVRDYMGLTRTYDLNTGYNHGGTDLGLWPFAWLRMETEQVQVVAAAPGVIVNKVDGNFDHNCSFAGTTANAIYIRHADGTVGWYLHLKKNSLTTKIVGDAVATGEFLGYVGSSGNSTGPHLHFEVHTGTGPTSTVIDPWFGPANTTISSTWWITQPAYYDSALNHIGTSLSQPSLPPCPQAEAPNESIQFAPGSHVYFANYFHDLLQTQAVTYQLLRPNGSTYATNAGSPFHAPQWFYAASYWYWSYTIPAGEPQGEWHWQITYNGHMYDHPFFIGGSPLYLPDIQH